MAVSPPKTIDDRAAVWECYAPCVIDPELAVFLELPDTKPTSEYIDGEIIPKPMPQGEHSTLQGDLVSVVNGALKSSKVGRAYPEPRWLKD